MNLVSERLQLIELSIPPDVLSLTVHGIVLKITRYLACCAWDYGDQIHLIGDCVYEVVKQNAVDRIPCRLLNPPPGATSTVTPLQSYNSSSVPPPPPQPTTSTPNSVDVNEAWNILTNPQFIKDQNGLRNFMEDLGVYKASSLLDLETSDLQQIRDYLKPVQKKEFSRFMKL